MKVLIAVLLGLLFAGPASAQQVPALHHEPNPHAWAVYFSPDGGATAAIVEVLGRAKASVLVQAYSFTSAPIAKALVEAHKHAEQWVR